MWCAQAHHAGAPNTRVQRTPVARYARPGSPLTRHPLDGSGLSPAWFSRALNSPDASGPARERLPVLLFQLGGPGAAPHSRRAGGAIRQVLAQARDLGSLSWLLNRRNLRDSAYRGGAQSAVRGEMA